MTPLSKKALISVSDKTGLLPLATFLVAEGYEILSTGGTAAFLKEAGVPITAVSDYTGSPEILDGRVKTLHPKIHGGILHRRALREDREVCEKSGIAPIDWVIVNLYPFVDTVSKPGVSFSDAIENIDIGGPSLLRAAAKNFSDVIVCVDPSDYGSLMSQWKEKKTIDRDSRLRLAQKVFSHTATYDAAISGYLGDTLEMPIWERPQVAIPLRLSQDLRYGENPHQRAGFFTLANEKGEGTWRVLQGKALSYNNLLDFTAAYALALDLDAPFSCVLVKHTNPCGVGLSQVSLREAFERALSCDPVSAFGGIAAFGKPVDGESAAALGSLFLEIVIAPKFAPEALAVFKEKKNLRVIEVNPEMAKAGKKSVAIDCRRVAGGFLLQEPDTALARPDTWKWVANRKAEPSECAALDLAWRVAKHVKSNAIVLANEFQTLGIGAGQMSRVDSVRLAGQKARFPLQGAALASDAFFPFRDNIDEAARLGIRAIVEPGGSVRDEEVIAACNEHGIAMAFTGERHFKH